MLYLILLSFLIAIQADQALEIVSFQKTFGFMLLKGENYLITAYRLNPLQTLAFRLFLKQL